MEINEYLKILKKRYKFIAIITILSVIISGVVSCFLLKPMYKSDISVIIGTNKDQEIQYNELQMYEKLTKTYCEFVKSRKVLQDISSNISKKYTVSELGSMISATPKTDTQFISISVKADQPELAREIAEQAAKSLKSVSLKVRNADYVRLLDEATLPKSPFSPRPMMNIAIAFLLGLMVSVGIVFLLEYLDVTVKTEQDIYDLIEVPVIGIIPDTTKQ